MRKLSRREFLKSLGLLGAAALVAGYEFSILSAKELARGGRSVSRTTGAPRHPVPTTCLMCPARCGIIGYLEDNILVKLEGNPKDPNSRGRICAKGLAGIQYLYNPDRLLHPLRREGARGEGKWQQISWEEAVTEVASKLKEIKESGHDEKFLFMDGEVGGLSPLTERFLKAFGNPTVLDSTALYRANKEAAHMLTWGAGTAINDVAHTKYILNFGANPYETHELYVPLVQRIIEGRMNGAKLVTFDPRVSNTAGKSDEWFPIKPGTDGLVALAMANVIMQLGLYDKTFADNWLNYPIDKLAAHLRQYTPEMAASISGVDAAHIRRIAIEFATTKPATTITGGGISQHANGVQNERAIALLNAITGNIDVRGGYCLPRIYEFTEPNPKPQNQLKLINPQEAILQIWQGKLKVGLLMSYLHNPAFSHPDTKKSLEVLQDEKLVPYYVAVDSYLTESAALADLVLPVATYLESWGLHSVPAYGLVPFVSLQQPLVSPQGEARAFPDICLQLAKKIGGGMEQYFQFGTVESYIRIAISKIDGLIRAGGLDYLKENGVWFDATAHPNYKSYETAGFKTPSGKFAVFSVSAQLAKSIAGLPTYIQIPEHRELKDGQFILITFQSNVQTHSTTANCLWLAEIEHTNPLWINKEVAHKHGIESGDLIRVTSPLGSIVAKAHVTNGIHPQVVAMAGSLGHWAYGRIAQARKFKSDDPNTELIWWGKEGNGVHPYALIPISQDPIGGGQAWLDTIVKLEKV